MDRGVGALVPPPLCVSACDSVRSVDLVIRNGRSETTGEPVELGIDDGVIVAVDRTVGSRGEWEIDAAEGMISPAFFEPHFHLENAFLWDQRRVRRGTLEEAIELYAELKRHLTTQDIVARASRALRLALEHGVLWLRSHVDIDHIAGLRILEGVVAARRRFEGVMEIQLVAFPQLGLARNAEALDLMWEAMEAGCDLVGGMPHGERDMDDAARHIESVFDIAQAYDVDIDMHIDETDDPYWITLELLADQTTEVGWQGRVTASHCCAMTAWDDARAARVIDKVHRADISVITNAPINMLLQGRADPYPKRRGITRVKQLLEAGVNMACGQDDVQNMFYPYGDMDPLEVALITAHAAQLTSPDEIAAAFDMPRYNAARLWPVERYGVEIGAEANLVVLDAASPVEALRCRPPRRYVVRRGRVLIEQRTERRWHVHT
jgi:cytosine deaminase